jgi:hypothetical protein
VGEDVLIIAVMPSMEDMVGGLLVKIHHIMMAILLMLIMLQVQRKPKGE